MDNYTQAAQDEKIKYSKILSSLFCSGSIIALSILSLLNNLTLDLYSTLFLLKVVIPASFCFWFLGYTIGKILDSYTNEVKREEIKQEQKAYEIPSIFSTADSASDSEEVL